MMEQLSEIVSLVGGIVTSVALPLLGVFMYYDSKKRTEAAKAKQAEAQARAAEEANITSYAEEWKALYEQRDKRVDELNAKIDALYLEKEVSASYARLTEDAFGKLLEGNPEWDAGTAMLPTGY